MFRLVLVLIYVFLNVISYYLPNVLVNDSQIVVFTLIAVHLLKELDWLIIKNSCKNSKNKFCKIFKKTNKKTNNGLINVKELNMNENEEKSLKETVL